MLRHRGPGQIQFWFIALGLGVASGLAAIAFRFAIESLQTLVYGTPDTQTLHSFAEGLPWVWVLLIPVFGGIVVGIILHVATPDGRVRAVADVIEGAALNDGRVEKKAGIASALCSWITLSTGGSTGREGPVVHIAAMCSSWVANTLKVDGITGRDLLGCAVAAAVSASFNAPIAGALFALEVILRHFALHAFAPIVVASAAGTVINRLVYGDVTEFVLPGTTTVEFYLELPAFFILGLVCGLVAVIMMQSVFFADDMETQLQKKLGLPYWLRPAVAGLLLGGIAIFFPHIIGVGYETTSRALTGGLLMHEALVFAVVKVAAVSITMAGRMGGGIFSPSLMVGALTGLTFGHIATGIFPEVSSAFTLYALAGMGAVAAAVLGAPISTTLIVFELTGDWQTGLAVMVSVSMSTAVASRLVDRSFFLTQLERRNVQLAAGPQAYLLAMFRVQGVMRKPTDEGAADEATCAQMIEDGLYVQAGATLKTALPMLDRTGEPFLPVVTMDAGEPVLQGALFHVDALKAYNRALAATAEEEHS
ncbi:MULTISPECIES: chloride channel protein [Mameliella]|uniref:Voltage-gated chloride channel n=2 Tax=Roseobacteraceae TaxID=2854170 RepID=A0A0B3RTK3_9RHOB|nr:MULTISPECIES: chloride channel protein [Mameliella]KHQ54305.1 Voltage-gated chloride channel [Mameliella alba]MBY6118581.1 chloride channel protein [Mameliella alba]PTR40105.1 CIC family chloride channel protein [Mameliella alba]SDC92659.1 chloride channel protein, CIC family [Mameliella alba]